MRSPNLDTKGEGHANMKVVRRHLDDEKYLPNNIEQVIDHDGYVGAERGQKQVSEIDMSIDIDQLLSNRFWS